jgi:hypothetical protein
MLTDEDATKVYDAVLSNYTDGIRALEICHPG